VITDKDLNWMAGIMDLKGKSKLVIAPSRNYRPLLVLYVESAQVLVIDELCKLTGTKGSDSLETEAGEWDKRGCSKHCPEAHIHVNKTLPATRRWSVTGASAAIVLHNVVPRLRNGSQQKTFQVLMHDGIRLAPKRGQGRGAVDATIKRLMVLGWLIPDELIDTGEEDAA
jgi:hypothetical protein